MVGNDEDGEKPLSDGQSSQGVFIYHPNKLSRVQEGRPSKKRRVLIDEPKSDGEKTYLPFQPLLNGNESQTLVKLRLDTYRKLWSKQEDKIQTILEELDAGILKDVTSFVTSTSDDRNPDRIPTTLIQIGSNISALTRMLDRLNRRLLADGIGEVVTLESGDALNLKTVIKNIIRNAITNRDGNEGYQKIFTQRVGPRFLPYDLEALYEYLKGRGMKHLVLAFRDSEAFDQGLLNDLLSLISSWNGRIPFTLIFGVSTSVDLFEGRLPRSIASLLQGRQFKVHDAGDSIERIYDSVQMDGVSQLWLGQHVTASLFDKSRDYFHSPEGFSRKVKFAYMSHFFANPLSSLLADAKFVDFACSELPEAIRNVSSFRTYCEELLEKGSSKQVSILLNDDDGLIKYTIDSLKSSQQKMRDMFSCVKLISNLQHISRLSKVKKRADLTVLALSGTLKDTAVIEDILLALKKMDSEEMTSFFAQYESELHGMIDLQSVRTRLATLLGPRTSKAPLRSKHSDQASILRTTVVGQRVNLSKTKATLTHEENIYAALLEELTATLGDYFTNTLINPQELFLKEVFLFDIRSPLRESFTPKIRFAIERALFSPFDYLASAVEETISRLSSAQPKTALLYQLYLESGSLVNVFDLWKAFSTIVGGDYRDQLDERLTLAFFYQALSELKAMGMVKASRKKIDHISKSAWNGL